MLHSPYSLQVEQVYQSVGYLHKHVRTSRELHVSLNTLLEIDYFLLVYTLFYRISNIFCHNFGYGSQRSPHLQL